MPNEPIISELNKKHYHALVEFFKSNNTPRITKYFKPFPFNESTINELIYNPKQNKYYVMLLGSKIIGFAMIRWWSGYEMPTCGLFIDHRHQGKGFGKRIYSHVFDEAKKLKCKKIVALVYSANINSIKMHKTCGFCEVGQKTVMEDGKPIEKIMLTKKLDE